MYILGISAYYHDSAACLLKEGEIIAAAQEERFTRKKHDYNFPSNAINFCLNEANIKSNELDFIAFYDKPLLKFNRLLETYLSFPGKGLSSFVMAMPLWLKQKLWIPDLIKNELKFNGTIIFPEHHESHAASAFFPSPFERAAFLTIDGVGEWAASSFGVGTDNKVEIDSELHFPHSLGLLYSAFTYFTGFKVNSGEYKVMGLAPYGEPKYVRKIYDHLIDLKEDGSFTMNMDYFAYPTGLKMTNRKFARLFNGPARKPESKLTQREMDLARSVQEVTEEIMLRMAKHVKKVTNEKTMKKDGVNNAQHCHPYHHHCNKPAIKSNGFNKQKGSYLGTSYSEDEIAKFIEADNLPHKKYSVEEMIDVVSSLLDKDNVIGWFQGKMEFGPRALGNRSIIGNARSPEMQKKMNLKIKYRESFRPFAPSVIAEEISNWFEIDRESPYMLLVADVKKNKQRIMTENEKNLWGIDKLNIVRSEVPAITHIDYSARIQSVNESDNALYHRLISKYFEKTGCPVIVNTSFNVRGEPIVESLLDAYKCFMRTEMDVLVLGNYVLLKEDQPIFKENTNWRKTYELD